MKVTFEDKEGVIPYGTRINQVQDRDLNEIKLAINTNDDKLTEVEASVAAIPLDSTAIGDPTVPIVPTGNVHCLGVGPGTYTNWGGMVIPANNFGNLKRVDGVYSVNLIAIADVNKMLHWVDGAYPTGTQRNYNGKDWIANTDTLLGDIPSVSIKWIERLWAYENKANLIVEKNIFNKATATIGYTISQTTGALTVNSGYDTSDFIPIIVGQAYKSNSETRLTTYFDANKNVVDGGSGSAITSFTTPAGVAYIRVSVLHTLLNTYQLEKGAVSTAYEDYQKVIQSAEISKLISRKSELPNFAVMPRLFTGKNLFNKTAVDVTLGSYVLIGNGLTAVNASYNATGFIPVIAGQQYSFSPAIAENSWYDSNKVYISGFNATNPVTAPAGAIYARCSVTVAQWNTFQFEQNSVPTAYESYYQIIKDVNGLPAKANSLSAAAVLEVATNMPANTMSGTKVLDNTISGEKTTFFEATKNLFNYLDANVQLGQYLTNAGAILASGSASLTGFIPITTGQTLYCNKVVGGGGYNSQYDINKNYIAGSSVNTSTVTGVSGCAFVRFSIQGILLQTIIDNLTQVEVGTAGTSFVPFTLIKKNVLPVSEAVPATDLQMPSTLYITNVKTDLFFEAIAKNYFRKDKFVRLSVTNASLDRHFSKLATITPASNGVATFKLYDTDFNVISSKAVNTIVTSASKTGNLKTMFVGSSITYGAKYIEYIKTICGAGITFLGIRKISSTGVLTEGRGGWGLGTYFGKNISRGVAYNGFYHPTTGRYWGATAYWADVMANTEFASGTTYGYDQDGFKTAATAAGFLSTGKISGAKLIVNDIMYDNTLSSYIQWNGTAWVTITEPPTWSLDFVKYSAMWTIAAPDLFFLAELATNDFRGSETDPNFTTWNAQLEQLITALKVWNASIKIAVTINFSTLGVDNGGLEFQERNNYRMWQCRKNVISTFDNRVAEGIYVIDNGIGFDQDYGFEINTWDDTAKPNELYTGAERLRIQYGNPHPNVDGNNLLGKCLVGIIQYFRA